jgi:pyruvate kinase
MSLPRIAIATGDPAGIGPEIALKAALDARVSAACRPLLVGDPAVVAIACYTETGRTAALLSAERPGVPIYAFVPDPRIRRPLNIRWGVRAFPAEPPADTDAMIALMADGLRESGAVREGRSVVMAASMPAGKAHTNMLKVHQLGEPVR